MIKTRSREEVKLRERTCREDLSWVSPKDRRRHMLVNNYGQKKSIVSVLIRIGLGDFLLYITTKDLRSSGLSTRMMPATWGRGERKFL